LKQARLHRDTRMINLAGVFRIGRPRDFKGKTILLCDDVMTTGATLAVAADTLLQSGAGAVKCFSLCRVV
jgi:predicted amidophosphoribosyltransferase